MNIESKLSDVSLNKNEPSNEPTYNLETGDILLFSLDTQNCCGCKFLTCLDWCIKCCTHSRYTHAALVIKNPTFTPVPLKGLYCFESTGLEGVPDVENHQIKFGVQLRKLQEVLQDYDGKVWVRKLFCERNSSFYKRLASAHSVVHNRPYDVDPIDWIDSLFQGKIAKLHHKKIFFCSALVAFVYVSLGLLPPTTDWTTIRPCDLSSTSSRVKFRNCHVGTEKKLK